MSKNIDFPFPGLFKGMGLTLKAMFTKAPVTMYPDEKEIPVPRARGVISLDAEACTVCMLCARECPDWCIYIEGPQGGTGTPTSRAVASGRRTSSIVSTSTTASACTAGICVEVCPFDALFWTPEYEYGEESISNLLHNQERLVDWLQTVPEPPALES